MEIQEISEIGRHMCLPLHKPRNRREIREKQTCIQRIGLPYTDVESSN